MRNIYLSLAKSYENEKLIETFSNDNEFNLVDLKDTKEKDITVVVNGPLTDLANILMNNWKVEEQIKEILFVGGSDKYGDVTPVAERHVWEDPESAQRIFLSRMHIVMFGLNVTRDIENRAILPYLYLKNPAAFETEECGIYVETKGKCTRGMTVIDIYSDKQFEHHDCLLVKKINMLNEEDLEKVNGGGFHFDRVENMDAGPQIFTDKQIVATSK